MEPWTRVLFQTILATAHLRPQRPQASFSAVDSDRGSCHRSRRRHAARDVELRVAAPQVQRATSCAISAARSCRDEPPSMPQPHANQQIFKEQELTCDCRAMCPCAPSGRRGSDSGHGHHHGKDAAQLRLLKPQHPGIRPTRAGAQITNHESQPLLPDAYVDLRSMSTRRACAGIMRTECGTGAKPSVCGSMLACPQSPRELWRFVRMLGHV